MRSVGLKLGSEEMQNALGKMNMLRPYGLGMSKGSAAAGQYYNPYE